MYIGNTTSDCKEEIQPRILGFTSSFPVAEMGVDA